MHRERSSVGRWASLPGWERTLARSLGLLALLVLAPVVQAQGPRAQPVAKRPPAPVASPIEVTVGGRTTVRLPGLQRLRILDPALADARVEAGGVVRLQGLARGRTELVFWRDGREERRVLVVR